jgi:nicotinate dehydrogenase subunit B
MSDRRDTSRAEWLAKQAGHFVFRDLPDERAQADLFLAIEPDGKITAFNGHVDLGTGIRTALAQIVAEELDVPFESVRIVLGTTTIAPDQGPTIASETIQITAIPLKQAAASARVFLLSQVAQARSIDPAALTVEDGVIRPINGENWSVSYGELVAEGRLEIAIDPQVPTKPVKDYRLVGTSSPRIDIPLKATGRWTYVHDVRLPGMLHGRVIRPPYAGYDFGDHVGNSLVEIDRDSVADVEGLIEIVAIGDFVGVVAAREEQAIEAADKLHVVWREPPVQPDLNAPEAAIRNNPSSPRRLADRGEAERMLESAETQISATYVWPYQMHGSIGPSCAVASFSDGNLTVWSGTQNPHNLQKDLAVLMRLETADIAIERLEAAGCYGRNGADDVTGDAALLARAVGRPVRVQLSRQQEHQWEPKGAGQVIDVRGGLDAEGGLGPYVFDTRYPSNAAPLLASLLTGRAPAIPITFEMGDRTAIPPYAYPSLKVEVHDMPQLARASWLRGVSAMPNTFAHESFIDELAAAAKVDPVEYRLRFLTDPRAADLVRATAARAGWQAHDSWGAMGTEGDIAYGRGFAYAVYVHGKFPGTAAAWAAWVAEVAVNKRTGEIAITRVVCGQDSGLVINPDGVKHQIHGNVVQSISRTLKESVEFSPTAVASMDWGAYPILQFPELPEIDALMIVRPDEPPLGVGESASVPSAAAIANAVYDATGIRFRELPLTPERVLAALQPARPEPAASPVKQKRKAWLAGISGLGLGALAAGALALLSPLRPAIEPISRQAANLYSEAAIEQGRLVAAAGGCVTCHAGPDGLALAGGHAFKTPFGTIHASNITPDETTGIGTWSYAAFERAMREGISRDGHHLYPAHPYPSFAGASAADLEALYAYLMSLPASNHAPPAASLSFPFNQRWLMAAWNAMFLKAEPARADAAQTASWNRGAYLVETLGHCSACHSPRNLLQAEMTGKDHLAGGTAEGWEAPALTALSKSPAGWNAASLYDYLRFGHSENHGSAGGPMADVVKSLAALPDADIRAMADYLASLNPPSTDEAVKSRAASAVTASNAATEAAALAAPRGARIFEGACASCHNETSGLASLALNSNLHSDRSTNVLQTIINGHPAPAILAASTGREGASLMAMPAFAEIYSDKQIGELAAYLRARFAPQSPAWGDVAETLQSLRP